MVFKKSLLCKSILVGMSLTAFQLKAAETSNGEEVGNTEKIEVTGSRIKRTEFSLPVPAQSLTIDDLEAIGANELSEAITEIPAVSPGITTETSQSSAQDSGLSTISLRNLGSERTLTLIDGRRTVGNTSTGSTVSLSTIPDAFVERIEVISGGASALYGSDAVTGVVNIITKRNFEGLTFDYRYGTSQEGGNDEKGIEIAAGANFNDNRGNLMFAFEWDEETAIYENQRSKMIDPRTISTSSDSPDEFSETLSTHILGGLFPGNSGTAADPSSDSQYWFYNNGGTGELTEDFNRSEDGYFALGPETASIPRERFLLASHLTFDLTDDIEFFANAHYSTVYTYSNRTPDTATSTRLFEDFPLYLSDGVTPHPYVPQGIFDDTLELGNDSIAFRRRWAELGNRYRDADNDTLRMWTGLRGYFADTWSWELNYGYGEWRRSQTKAGDLLVANYQQSIDVEYVDATDTSLGLQCANEFARDSGCVALDIFGLGAVTDEAVDWLKLTDKLLAKNETTTVSGWLTGDVVDLWAGPLSMATGFDYREEKSQTRWDNISTSGGSTATQQVDQTGQQEVTEVFIELIMPLVKDTFFADYISVEGAYRVSDYSTVGSINSWKFGGSWVLNDQVTFRSVVAEANRAPNNIELFSVGLGSQGGLNDPCDLVTATSTQSYSDTCRQDPSVASIIASEGIFEDDSNQVQQPTFGNEGLGVETGKTFTAGVVYSPDFIPNLTVALDYYDITIENAISEIEAEDILQLCYSSGDFNSTESCSIPVRDVTTGQLTEVSQTSLNTDELRTKGYDATFSYNLDGEDIGLSGSFKVSGTYNIIKELEEESPVPGTTETFINDELGLLGTPDRTGRFSVSWRDGPIKVSWRTLHIGSMLNDNYARDRLNACHEYSNCSDKINLFIRDVTTHNLRVSYKIEDVLGGDHNLYFGINNITNDQGPNLFGDGNVGENHSSLHDLTGRFFYGGFKTTF
ncbi:TonB-dependent receptor plug domain-containing protein [Paraglaciecola sp.]|uniref:TonB-dependent receptor plug domain-containing protein n=1 Tax=Paraglaciecola sp. TaxID=1920173 RepID=UPI0032675962